jgi:pilus assembly protein CpaB
MTRRLLAITVAIALAAVGTAGILWYVISTDKRVQAELTDPVTVAVADRQIPVGTTGLTINEQKMVRFVQMPKGAVPEADVISAFGPEFDQLVTTATVEKGFMVLRPMFGDRSQVTSRLPTPDGKMAITVETTAPEQVAGYVQAGAQVTIFATYRLLNEQGEETKFTRTKVLLPKVEVLAVGTYQRQNGDGNEDGGVGGSTSGEGALLITVAVNQGEAERLILAKNMGSLYLGLLTSGIDVKAGPGVESTDNGPTTPLFK